MLAETALAGRLSTRRIAGGALVGVAGVLSGEAVIGVVGAAAAVEEEEGRGASDIGRRARSLNFC